MKIKGKHLYSAGSNPVSSRHLFRRFLDRRCFLDVAYFLAFAAAFCKRQRFFVAAIIAALPAAESLRFGLGVAFGVDGSAAFLEAAHLFRWASAIAFLPATLILRRFLVGASGVATGAAGPGERMARSWAILVSSFSFWASIPKIAAFRISVVSFGVGMLLDLSRFFHRTSDAVIHTTPTMTLGGCSARYLLC